MRQIFLACVLTIALKLSGQEKFLLDTSKIDGSTKLIGRYPQYDKGKTYRNLNFIIDNPDQIKQIVSTLALGQERPNTIEEPGFTISVIQNKSEITIWTVNPNSNSVLHNGHTYEFDISKLKALALKYPFDYRFDKIPFKTKEEFESYLNKQRQDSNFLFDYRPQFKYEGSFEIQFSKNKQFSSPKAICEYLEPLIEKIVSKNEYSIRYMLDDKNRNDQSQFTMTITGSKKLYQELTLSNLKKENWQETVEQAWFFYRTK